MAVLGALMVLVTAALVPLAILARQMTVGGALGTLLITIPAAAIGVLVARRQPGNPIGWILLGVALFDTLGSAAGAYAVLDYRLGYRWPAGPGSVLLALYWAPLIVTFPLAILLFPDGRLPPRWRWVFWSYLPVAVSWPAAIYAVAISAVAGHDIHLLPGGDLAIVDHPAGSAAWLSGAESVILPVLAVFWLSFVGRQVASWRRADGERRQQLKWLMSGAAICMASLTVTVVFGTLDTKASPAAQSALDVLSLAVVALPVSMGVAILKYRLYDIDRIISRTLAYAIVTGLLVGVYAGLVLLATEVFRFHAPVAVAAATLAAAALFNPLRRRVQRAVDRRFNRARYDAEQTVAALAARLKDAVDLDSVRDDLATVVQKALEPVHVSVWMNERR